MDNICKQCSKVFHTYKSEQRSFCTLECYFESKRIIRKCPQCGKERKHAKAQDRKDFCSMICWNKFKQKKTIYICKQCNKEIIGHPSKIRKTCSKKCANEFRTLPVEEFKRRWYQRVKEYRKNNPNKTATWKQNRRSRELGAHGSFTALEWKELQIKFNKCCAICKTKTKLTVDHIIPLCKGGTNFIKNIQPLCMPCNSKKHTKIYEQSKINLKKN